MSTVLGDQRHWHGTILHGHGAGSLPHEHGDHPRGPWRRYNADEPDPVPNGPAPTPPMLPAGTPAEVTIKGEINSHGCFVSRDGGTFINRDDLERFGVTGIPDPPKVGDKVEVDGAAPGEYIFLGVDPERGYGILAREGWITPIVAHMGTVRIVARASYTEEPS